MWIGFQQCLRFQCTIFRYAAKSFILNRYFRIIKPGSYNTTDVYLPVKAKYLSYGTIIITFLTFLAKANPHGAYHLGGILFGYLYFSRVLGKLSKFIYLKYLEWELKKKRSRFKVVDGFKDKEDKDKPTYH